MLDQVIRIIVDQFLHVYIMIMCVLGQINNKKYSSVGKCRMLSIGSG